MARFLRVISGASWDTRFLKMLEVANNQGPPLLLFYPTSPVHVRDFRLIIERLPNWRFYGIVFRPLARVAPGIDEKLREEGIDFVVLNSAAELSHLLPDYAATLVLPAVFEPFALELMAWSKMRSIPVIAIEEVAQLALNQLDINNYDAPFDRLFVASAEEFRLFEKLGYPPDMLRISGLLANDRVRTRQMPTDEKILARLGIKASEKLIVYTTSPIKSRLSLHNKDDVAFRESVLRQLTQASHRTGHRLLIKLHPNENIDSSSSVIRQINPQALVIDRNVAMDELFSVAAVLVNRGNSQTCLDAVLRGVPTIVLAAGLETLFQHDGGAYIAEHLNDLTSTILTALTMGAPDTSRVRNNHFFAPAEGVASLIAQEIEATAAKSCPTRQSTWNWIIRSMLFMGQHDSARRLCDSLHDDSPWRDEVRRALESHAYGKLSDAATAWQKCSNLDAQWYFPHYELAHTFLALELPEKALSHAEQANELHPPFHKLWHEIPMAIVAMASLRKMGRSNAARQILHLLEDRGLVDITPELLIEKAAQQDMTEFSNCNAEQRLTKAMQLLNDYPVDEKTDRQIKARAISQYFYIAKWRATAGDNEESFRCLKRALSLVDGDAKLRDQSLYGLIELAENRLVTADDGFVSNCCEIARDFKSSDPWLLFLLARLHAKVGSYGRALHHLLVITRIPEGTRNVAENVLSPGARSRLNTYWPDSPRAIRKPIKLLIFSFGWFLQRGATLRGSSLRDGIFLSILAWVCVIKHFVDRLQADTTGLR